mmetsp:Transcript_16210/g.45205  ORF Transcript_16210/g.45205 Transcript_16210/m.45205 type:complete len:162 (-) Transcript_16210:127-612(-)
MAPEMIDSPHAHDTSVDWWALGVLTFELLTLQVPFDAPDCDDVMLKLVTIRRGQEMGIPEKLLPQGLILAKDFIKALCQVDDERRLGRKEEVRRHAWFTYQKFEWHDLETGRSKSPHSSSKKVVERILPTLSDIASLNAAEKSNALFVEYVDDGTGWDEAF